jgi:hypothetical protein
MGVFTPLAITDQAWHDFLSQPITWPHQILIHPELTHTFAQCIAALAHASASQSVAQAHIPALDPPSAVLGHGASSSPVAIVTPVPSKFEKSFDLHKFQPRIATIRATFTAAAAAGAASAAAVAVAPAAAQLHIRMHMP